MRTVDDTAPAVDRDAETARLLRAAQSGDREAFGRIVELHQRAVTRLAYRILGDPDEADAASQDAFVKAWRSVGGFRDACPLEGWLARIVVNTCRDRLKQRRRNMENVLETEPRVVANRAADPETHVAGREIARKIAEHIGTLPDMQRDVFALRYYEDRSLAEIAVLLRVSVGTVKTHLFRATRRVRQSIEALYGARFPFP